MKPTARLRCFLLLSSSLLALSSASAQSTLYWDGGTTDITTDGNGASGGTAGTWDTTIKNWDAGASPHVAWDNTNNDTAVFGGTSGTVTLGANVTVGGLTFNTNGYSVAPGTGPFGITFGAPGDINVSTGTTTITAAIGGSSAITKTGGGTLVLNATNTFSGGITVNGGSLHPKTAGSLGNSGNTVAFAGNSTFGDSSTNIDLTQNFTVNDGVKVTWQLGGNNTTRTVSGTLSGSGTFFVNATKGVKFTNTGNTFSGAIETGSGIFAGLFETASIGDGIGAGTIRIGTSGSTGIGTFAWSDSADAALTLTNRQFLLGQGGRISNFETGAGNVLTVNSNLGSAGDAATKTLTLEAASATPGTNVFAGSIGDAGGTVGVSKTGAGIWQLGNTANSYTGATSITGGTLEVTKLADGASNSSIGASSASVNNLRLLNNTTLRYTGGGDSTNRNFSLQGSATIDSSGAGTLNFTQTGTLSPDYSDATASWSTSAQRIINVADTSSLAVGMRVTGTGIANNTVIQSINSATQVTVNNNFTANGSDVDFGYATNRTLTLRGGNTGANTIAGVLQDSTANGIVGVGVLSVTKNDGGTWVLEGDNTYTGATTVSAGTLIINGNSSTATGNVTVASGATLGGIGTVGGATTLNGVLSPGNSPGTLTFGGNLTVNNGSTYLFEAGDLTVVDGTLDLNDNWTLSLGLGFQDGGSVTLFEYGTLAASPDLSPTFFLDNLGFTPSGALSLTDTGSEIVLNGVSVIPEPRAALLGGLGMLVLLRRRRS